MKFSIASAAFLAVVAVAVDAAKPDLRVTTTPARIQVGGLVQSQLTQQDLVVLDQIVLEAMNAAYENADVMSFESKETFALVNNDEETTLILSEFVTPELGCRFCPPDKYDDWGCYVDPNCGRLEGVSDEQFLAHQAGKMHFDMEKQICKKLRKSGVPAFAQAKDCSFSFVEEPEAESVRLNEENTYESLAGKAATDAEITLGGVVAQELSKPHLKYLESVIMQTHADAYHQTGYALLSFDINTMLESTDKTVIGLARAIPTLDESAPAVANSLLLHLHETFEHAVCRNLQEGGLVVFANVKDCSFRFVYNPVQEAKAVIATVASVDRD